MNRLATATAIAALVTASTTWAVPVVITFEAAGPDAVAITPIRDAFRAAVGGGTAPGANGSFGGVRREINWDGVPDDRADPNALPANFFNTTSPRGAVFSTPGTGFLVSANASTATPTLFGFGSDFQTFSAQRLFTAIGSNITDVHFFVPGTNIAATTSAFGVIFTDVEVAGPTQLEFFDETGSLFYEHDALLSGNRGLSFLGATVSGGRIGRVRITSGVNTLLRNGVLGNPNDDVVVMDDFIYAEPNAAGSVPTPSSLALVSLALVLGLGQFCRRRSAL